MSLKPWMSRRFLVAASAMTVLLVLLAVTATRLIISENTLSRNVTEDMVWLASQGQYEAVRFADALNEYRRGDLQHRDLQLRMDLLISRVMVLKQGEPGEQMKSLGFANLVGEYSSVLANAKAKLSQLRPIDTASIAALRQQVLPLSRTLRDVANAALLAKRDAEVTLRDRRHRTLVELLTLLVATMGAGIFLAAILLREHRSMVAAEAALERERQVSKLHRGFISIVSHQFRTPISIIDSSAQRMIRRGADMETSEVTSRAEKIRNACLRLTRLIESTLNASRLEEGEISFVLRPFDPAKLIQSICENLPDEDQPRMDLDLCSLPDWIMADVTLLEQALQNLISNGLKYSTADQNVTVKGAVSGGDVVIQVADRGVGIPADELNSVSQRFFRARTAEGIPGTGIGLSFASQVMEMHGGRLDIESIEGSGSTFTLRFPYKPGRPADVVQADGIMESAS